MAQKIILKRSNTTEVVSGSTVLQFGEPLVTNIGGEIKLYIGDENNLAQEITGSVGGASSITTLTDVDLTSVANNDILKYNSVSGKWENITVPNYLHNGHIQDLGNVSISNLQDGQSIYYDTVDSLWKNGTPEEQIDPIDTTVSSSTPITLVSSSAIIQEVVGNTTQTFTLPDATLQPQGTKYVFKNNGTYPCNIIINPALVGQTIDGDNQLFIKKVGNSITLATDGSKWIITEGKKEILPKFSSSHITNSRTNFFIYGNDLYAMGNSADGLVGTDLVRVPTIKTVPNQGVAINGWKDIVYTFETALALTNDGRCFEWGNNTGVTNYLPIEAVFPAGVVIDKIYGHSGRGENVASSWFAISTTGQLYSWRNNQWGQLGLGNTVFQSTPQLVQGALAGKVITKLSVSGNNGMHVAAIDSTGQLYTWGYNGGNASSPLGNGANSGDISTPFLVPNMSDVVDVLAAGCYSNVAAREYNMTRVIKADGTTWACGHNQWGVLATGNTTDANVFVQESTLSTDFVKMFGANIYQGVINAVIKSDGKLYFSGKSWDGSMGNGTPNNTAISSFANTPQLDNAGFQGKMLENGNGIVPKVGFIGTIAGGLNSTVVLDNAGQLWASGHNYGGQLGTGSTNFSVVSFFEKCTLSNGVPVIDFTTVGLNQDGQGIIALCQDGSLWAAGYSVHGSLGDFVTGTNAANPFFRNVIGFAPNAKN